MKNWKKIKSEKDLPKFYEQVLCYSKTFQEFHILYASESGWIKEASGVFDTQLVGGPITDWQKLKPPK